MTAAQRLRLVLALGTVNFVLAVVAFAAIAGGPSQQVAGASATPGRTDAAVASPIPTPAGTPGHTTPPATAAPTPPQPTPSGTPAPTEVPSPTSGPVAVATRGPVIAPHTAAPATSAPATAAPATSGPQPPPDPNDDHDADRTHPPCPGSVDGAPGHHKVTGPRLRPCRGGEHAGDTAPPHVVTTSPGREVGRISSSSTADPAGDTPEREHGKGDHGKRDRGKGSTDDRDHPATPGKVRGHRARARSAVA